LWAHKVLSCCTLVRLKGFPSRHSRLLISDGVSPVPRSLSAPSLRPFSLLALSVSSLFSRSPCHLSSLVPLSVSAFSPSLSTLHCRLTMCAVCWALNLSPELVRRRCPSWPLHFSLTRNLLSHLPPRATFQNPSPLPHATSFSRGRKSRSDFYASAAASALDRSLISV
jgi:hypothetical protein